jgi:hypothetical protein
MMFESQTGMERNKTVQLVLAAILVVAICIFFLYSKANAPRKDSVDGVYRSECCRDIIIRDGRVSYGTDVVDMKLLNMKFGLTGYVDGKFTSQGIRATKEPTEIDFSSQGQKRTLSLLIDQQDHTFQLIEGSAEKRR